MDEDIEVLKGYVESLGLDKKTDISSQDKQDLINSLRDADEDTLAAYVSSLKSPAELQDLIVNTLYA